MLFRLSSHALVVVVVALMSAATAAGTFAGRRMGERRDTMKESVGVVQGALLGFIGLLLAFGMTMAVGRYESRRAAVVSEANAIGTTYLRAQTLAEPVRSQSLDLLRRYTRDRVKLSELVIGTAAFDAAVVDAVDIQSELWGLAGKALTDDPIASAPRLYVESLNEMINAHTVRVAALANRVPSTVVYLQLLGGVVAVGLLAMHLAVIGRSVTTAVLAAAMVSLILLVTLDLDRPVRGLITVPATPLVSELRSMDRPPAAVGPARP